MLFPTGRPYQDPLNFTSTCQPQNWEERKCTNTQQLISSLVVCVFSIRSVKIPINVYGLFCVSAFCNLPN